MEEEKILQELLDDPNIGIRHLIESYGGLVRAVTYRRLSGRLSREDIEECVSDIFLEIYQYREQIDLEKGTIKSVLLKIAERKAYKYYDRKPEKFQKEPLEDYMDSSEAGTSENVLESVISKEESRQLVEAVMGLGEPTNQMIIMKYYYGMTAKDIGKRLGYSKNAVEKRIRRGLDAVKGVISRDMGRKGDLR